MLVGEQLGSPIAYLALTDGTPVYDRSGNRIGVVEHPMAEGGIFEGVIFHTHPLPGRHLYAEADPIVPAGGALGCSDVAQTPGR